MKAEALLNLLFGRDDLRHENFGDRRAQALRQRSAKNENPNNNDPAEPEENKQA